MNIPCSITWCAALAVDESDYCVVHRKRTDIHPDEIDPQEEIDDAYETGYAEGRAEMDTHD